MAYMVIALVERSKDGAESSGNFAPRESPDYSKLPLKFCKGRRSVSSCRPTGPAPPGLLALGPPLVPETAKRLPEFRDLKPKWFSNQNDSKPK